MTNLGESILTTNLNYISVVPEGASTYIFLCAEFCVGLVDCDYVLMDGWFIVGDYIDGLAVLPNSNLKAGHFFGLNEERG